MPSYVGFLCVPSAKERRGPSFTKGECLVELNLNSYPSSFLVNQTNNYRKSGIRKRKLEEPNVIGVCLLQATFMTHILSSLT